MAESIFASQAATLFAVYDVAFEFSGRLAGSLPSDPVSIIEMVTRQMGRAQGKTREQLNRAEVLNRARKFMAETDPTDPTIETISDEDLEKLALEKSEQACNVFRSDELGLYIPSHSIKAAMKEAVNVLYAKERWGRTGKGPLGFLAERVFVAPDRVYLLRKVEGEQVPGVPLIVKKADGTETLHGVVSGPLGKRSIVTQHEFVEAPCIRFQLRVLAGVPQPPPKGRAKDKIDEDLEKRDNEQADALMSSKWPVIFSYMESNGIGSHRKLSGYGLFATTRFERRG